jgi:hypothetical protein
MAFPSLARRARSFRTWIIFLVILLIFWLVITCRLSWDVATGNALLTQFTTAQVASDDIRNKILDAQAPSIGVPPGTTRTPGGTQAAPAGVLSPSQYCSGAEDDNADSSDEHSGNKAASATAGSGVAATTGGSDATHQRLCVNRKQANRNYRLAQSNLQAWMQPGNRFMVRWFVGGYFDLGREITSQARLGTDRAAKPADLDEQWAAVWLAILGGVVLPIFYGVLGAGAAVVRNLSFKMRDSLLAPRDLTLSWVRLVLGAVIGGCVGLFISPSGSAADNPSLLGTVHLSAAALCFIAGFGVEAVFQALEGLISRAFNTGDASRK